MYSTSEILPELFYLCIWNSKPGIIKTFWKIEVSLLHFTLFKNIEQIELRQKLSRCVEPYLEY